MQTKIEAKLQQAREQLIAWQREQAAAAVQVERWAAVVQCCEELLADELADENVYESPPDVIEDDEQAPSE